jgi:hypothetical protein
MYPLIATCLWMWYLIVKKAIDMYAYTRDGGLYRNVSITQARQILSALYGRKG